MEGEREGQGDNMIIDITDEDDSMETQVDDENSKEKKDNSPTSNSSVESEKNNRDSILYGFSVSQFKDLIEKVNDPNMKASMDIWYLALNSIFTINGNNTFIVPPSCLQDSRKSMCYFASKGVYQCNIFPENFPLDDPIKESRYDSCLIPIWYSDHISLVFWKKSDPSKFIHYDSLEGQHSADVVVSFITKCYKTGILGEPKDFCGSQNYSLSNGPRIFCGSKNPERSFTIVQPKGGTPQQLDGVSCGFYSITIGIILLRCYIREEWPLEYWSAKKSDRNSSGFDRIVTYFRNILFKLMIRASEIKDDILPHCSGKEANSNIKITADNTMIPSLIRKQMDRCEILSKLSVESLLSFSEMKDISPEMLNYLIQRHWFTLYTPKNIHYSDSMDPLDILEVRNVDSLYSLKKAARSYYHNHGDDSEVIDTGGINSNSNSSMSYLVVILKDLGVIFKSGDVVLLFCFKDLRKCSKHIIPYIQKLFSASKLFCLMIDSKFDHGTLLKSGQVIDSEFINKLLVFIGFRILLDYCFYQSPGLFSNKVEMSDFDPIEAINYVSGSLSDIFPLREVLIKSSVKIQCKSLIFFESGVPRELKSVVSSIVSGIVSRVIFDCCFSERTFFPLVFDFPNHRTTMRLSNRIPEGYDTTLRIICTPNFLAYGNRVELPAFSGQYSFRLSKLFDTEEDKESILNIHARILSILECTSPLFGDHRFSLPFSHYFGLVDSVSWTSIKDSNTLKLESTPFCSKGGTHQAIMSIPILNS